MSTANAGPEITVDELDVRALWTENYDTARKFFRPKAKHLSTFEETRRLNGNARAWADKGTKAQLISLVGRRDAETLWAQFTQNRVAPPMREPSPRRRGEKRRRQALPHGPTAAEAEVEEIRLEMIDENPELSLVDQVVGQVRSTRTSGGPLSKIVNPSKTLF